MLYVNETKTKIGRLFYMTVNDDELGKLFKNFQAVDLGHILETLGYIKLIDVNGEWFYEETGKAKGNLTRDNIRKILKDFLSIFKVLSEDKPLLDRYLKLAKEFQSEDL